MSDQREPKRREGLVPAIQNLTDGVSDLVRSQFELIRLEVKNEATEAGRRGGSLLLYTGIALLGYGLLNLALILVAGWFFGITGMTLAALGLGLAHLGFGVVQSMRHIEEFQEQHERLERKTRSLTGKQPWLEENPEN